MKMLLNRHKVSEEEAGEVFKEFTWTLAGLFQKPAVRKRRATIGAAKNRGRSTANSVNGLSSRAVRQC